MHGHTNQSARILWLCRPVPPRASWEPRHPAARRNGTCHRCSVGRGRQWL